MNITPAVNSQPMGLALVESVASDPHMRDLNYDEAGSHFSAKLTVEPSLVGPSADESEQFTKIALCKHKSAYS